MMPLYDDSRAAWSAAPNTNPTRVAPSTRTHVTYHWDGGTNVGLFGKAHSSCLTRVRAIQRFHQGTRGWADIGYNLLICVHGRVIEGRGVDLQGAHAGPSANVEKIGVQFMIGGSELATTAMFARALRLEADLNAHCGKRLLTDGHRDNMSTTCPGNQIYTWAHSTHNLSGTTPTTPSTGGFTVANIEDAKQIWRADIIPAPGKPTTGNVNWQPDSYLRLTYEAVARVESAVKTLSDPAALAAAIVAAMPAEQGQVTQETVEAAVRSVLGSLDNAPAGGAQ